ncbi:MAG TPA: bifunctional riboflavin kinase/FAD synthetase [Candidatus Ozemobacteraceae bacterium]|nr:bifunctional riboflavin kinase/FAD synthetase [Candidatus Ozemobacteraceae bacterium]
MNLYNLLSGPIGLGPCVVGLGAFDGVHRGHQTLISGILAESRRKELAAVVFTFDHPPRRLLDPVNFPGEITTPEEKFGLLLSSGVDAVVFRPFDEEFARTTPEQFIRDVLIGQLDARHIFVGFNFGFGLHRRGSADFMRNELERLERACTIIPPVTAGHHLVSSTLIREAIGDGDIELATHLLGRHPAISGEVIHGDHRGREMGFPTANLSLEGSIKVLPPKGVYYCLVDTPRGTHHAMVNIGTRPTFDRRLFLLEAHLLDFAGDLYHTTIRVRFVKRLREEIRFPSMADLVGQIRTDLAAVRALQAAGRSAAAQD